MKMAVPPLRPPAPRPQVPGHPWAMGLGLGQMGAKFQIRPLISDLVAAPGAGAWGLLPGYVGMGILTG